MNKSWGSVPAALALSLAPLLQKRVLLRGLLGRVPYIYIYIYIKRDNTYIAYLVLPTRVESKQDHQRG